MKNKWDDFYKKYGEIDFEPEESIVKIVDELKLESVVDILDVGCGTGRNSDYLSKKGFNVHAFDVSAEAIKLAKQQSNSIDYKISTIADIQFPTLSMDFIFALHSLEYGTWNDICCGVENINNILKQNRPLFIVVDSIEHPFYCPSKVVDEVSTISFSIRNNLPNYFFTEEELVYLFRNYEIKSLKHVSIDQENISPIREWRLWGCKK